MVSTFNFFLHIIKFIFKLFEALLFQFIFSFLVVSGICLFFTTDVLLIECWRTNVCWLCAFSWSSIDIILQISMKILQHSKNHWWGLQSIYLEICSNYFQYYIFSLHGLVKSLVCRIFIFVSFSLLCFIISISVYPLNDWIDLQI